MEHPATVKARLFQQSFATEYLKTGLNGTEAYQRLRPHVTRGTARVEAVRILANPNTRQEIERIMTENGQEIEWNQNSSAKVAKTEFDRLKEENPTVAFRYKENLDKLFGLMVDRVETTNFDGDKREDMRKQALKEAEQALEALIETDRGGEGQTVIAKDVSGSLT